MPGHDWEVFVDDHPHPIRTTAETAKEAVDIVKAVTRGTSYRPHIHGCDCERVDMECMQAKLERTFKGTRLGKLCRL
jgi:hypothetical protein